MGYKSCSGAKKSKKRGWWRVSRAKPDGSVRSVFPPPENRVEHPQVRAYQRKRRDVEGEKAVYLFFDVHDGVTEGEQSRAERDEEVVHRAERHCGGFGFGRWMRLPSRWLRLALLLLR